MKDRILFKIQSQGLIKRKELLTEMQLHYPELRDRKMRLLIAELIKEGEPIASSSQGYSIIKTRGQLNKAIAYLNAKSSAIAIRKNTLVQNFNRTRTSMDSSEQYRMEL